MTLTFSNLDLLLHFLFVILGSWKFFELANIVGKSVAKFLVRVVGHKHVSKDSNWSPPLKCRWFGHKFKDTEHQVATGPMGLLASPVEQCERCRCGRVLSMFGYTHFLPKAIDDFIIHKNAVQNGDVVDFTSRLH